MTCKNCGVTEDGKILICPMHYRIFISDSNINLYLNNNKTLEHKIEYINNIAFIKT